MAQTPATETTKYGDGTSRQFTFDFVYLDPSDVFVEVDGTPVVHSLVTSNTLELVEAPAQGASVYIYRSTPAFTVAHQFQLGAPFLPRYIDDNFNGLLFATQESVTASQGAVTDARDYANDAKGYLDDVIEIAGGVAYEDLGDYAPGISLTSYFQLLKADGELWRLAPSATLPYITTGGGMPEGGNFLGVGDAALRADLGTAAFADLAPDQTSPQLGEVLTGEALDHAFSVFPDLASEVAADGKVLAVGAGGAGYELVDFHPVVPLTGPVDIIVVETVLGDTDEFPSIMAAIRYVQATYVPAGGQVTITWYKKVYHSIDDVLTVLDGENLSHIKVVLAGGYFPADTASPLITVGEGAIGPAITTTGAPCTLAPGRGLCQILGGGALTISGSFKASAPPNLYPIIVVGNGGILRAINTTLEVVAASYTVIRVGPLARLEWTGGTLAITSTPVGGSDSPIVVDGGTFELRPGAAPISTSANAACVSVLRGGSVYLADTTTTVGGGTTGVAATLAGTINLSRSPSVTCNLADNTISTNGILVR